MMSKLATIVLSLFIGAVLVPATGLGVGGDSGGGNGGGTTARPEDPLYAAAVKAVKANDYRAAIPLLEKVVAANAEHADAFNYLGYSHRNLGEFDKAMAHYRKALELNPNHRGAHEYIGELYLQRDDLKRAEEHLARLDKICFFGCEEYTDLKKAIAAYKKARGIS